MPITKRITKHPTDCDSTLRAVLDEVVLRTKDRRLDSFRILKTRVELTFNKPDET